MGNPVSEQRGDTLVKRGDNTIIIIEEEEEEEEEEDEEENHQVYLLWL